uniref:2, 3-dihydroxybiphenyl 1, 2-dioxygenase n=1 Tax=Rhodococcus rhodochrous TaxID=1829 RepID=Q762H4_RHORH|nr:2, 3-dihydroxybiphenyl 1, 2-dioxygenase [Rhodococcus rhodochrous]
MTIHSLGYLRLSSVDVDAWTRFGTQVLGMTADRSPQGGVAFRMDEHAARLEIVAGESGGVSGIGFEVESRDVLDSLTVSLRDQGVDVRTGTSVECDVRRVRDLRMMNDPFGMPLELYSGPSLVHDPLETVHVREFVTGDLGMGHVVIGGPESDEALEFYRDALGFVDRNTMRAMGPDGKRGDERITFLGCNRRHHTVALMKRPAPAQLIHFMVEVGSIDDVGRAYDRALNSGIQQRLTLGRHSNDGMVSFYSMTPDGFTVEVGCEGRLVEPGTPTYETTATSYWGHRKVSA